MTILPFCVDQSVITFSSIFLVCTLCLTIIGTSPKYPVITIKFIVSTHYFQFVQSHVRFLRSFFLDSLPSAHCKAAISFNLSSILLKWLVQLNCFFWDPNFKTICKEGDVLGPCIGRLHCNCVQLHCKCK